MPETEAKKAGCRCPSRERYYRSSVLVPVRERLRCIGKAARRVQPSAQPHNCLRVRIRTRRVCVAFARSNRLSPHPPTARGAHKAIRPTVTTSSRPLTPCSRGHPRARSPQLQQRVPHTCSTLPCGPHDCPCCPGSPALPPSILPIAPSRRSSCLPTRPRRAMRLGWHRQMHRLPRWATLPTRGPPLQLLPGPCLVLAIGRGCDIQRASRT